MRSRQKISKAFSWRGKRRAIPLKLAPNLLHQSIKADRVARPITESPNSGGGTTWRQIIVVIGSLSPSFYSAKCSGSDEKPCHHYRLANAIEQLQLHQPITMTLPTSGAAPMNVGGIAGGSDSMLLGLTCLSVLSLLYAFFVVRPRTKGGSSAPPTVTNSPVSGLPVVGTIVEFGKSPVKMVQRCYEEYGPVFTVPVSFT